jgi:hypothetical protein
MDDSKTPSGTNYDRLALLAYVILWDLKPAHRIEQAVRIVRRCVPWRESNSVRRRVLKRCIRTPWGTSYRSRARLGMRPTGAALDSGLASAIRRLGREERVAYVLQRVEGLGAEETAAELRRLRVSDVDSAVHRALKSVDTDTELNPEEQRAAILGLDLQTVAFSPRWSPRPARIRLAALLAGALAVVVVGVVLGWPGKKAPLRVNARAGTYIASLSGWPAQGDRVHDRALLGRARDAWEGAPALPAEDGERYGSVKLHGLREVPYPRPAPGTLIVLFAGTVGPGRSVLLFDGALLALYSEGTSDGKSLTVETTLPLAHLGPLAVSPPVAGGTRQAYLLPPDTVRAEVATLADTRPTWQTATPRNGVITMPDRQNSSNCRRTLFHTSWKLSSGRVDSDVFTGLENPLTTTQISWTSPGAKEFDAAPIDTRLVRDVICDDDSFSERNQRSVTDVDLEAIWNGALPEGHHQAAFVSLAALYGRGQPDPPKDLPIVTEETQTLFVDQPPNAPGITKIVESESGSGIIAGVAGDTAYATASWHAPSGRWYLIAGGTPKIARIRAWGKHEQKAKGRTLILRGPKSHGSKAPDWSTSVDAETKTGEPGESQ